MQFPKKVRDSDRSVEKVLPHLRDYKKLISGGLAAFSGVCVTQMLSVNSLDFSLKIALGAFAVSIPFLVKDVLDTQTEERYGIRIVAKSRIDALALGWIGSLIGIAAVFYHFAPWIFWVFVTSCILCLRAHDAYGTELAKERSREKAEDAP